MEPSPKAESSKIISLSDNGTYKDCIHVTEEDLRRFSAEELRKTP